MGLGSAVRRLPGGGLPPSRLHAALPHAPSHPPRHDRTMPPQAFVEAQNALTQTVLAQCESREPFRRLFTQLYDYEKYGALSCSGQRCWAGHAVGQHIRHGVLQYGRCQTVSLPCQCRRQLSGRPLAPAGTPYRKGQRYYFSHNSGLQNQYVVSSAARPRRPLAAVPCHQAQRTVRCVLLHSSHVPWLCHAHLPAPCAPPRRPAQLYSQGSLEGERRVLIDPNTLSEDGTVALGGQSFSEDGTLYGARRRGAVGAGWGRVPEGHTLLSAQASGGWPALPISH